MSKSYAWELLEKAPKGTTLHTIVRHVSQSGMQRVIDAFILEGGEMRSLRGLADDTNLKIDRNHDGFVMKGAGMDMAWYLTHLLGEAVHNDGDWFRHRNL